MTTVEHVLALHDRPCDNIILRLQQFLYLKSYFYLKCCTTEKYQLFCLKFVKKRCSKHKTTNQ